MRISPTNKTIVRRSPRGKKNGRSATAAACRVKQPIPEIRVKVDRPYQFATYARAYLRNKRGYVYLCWRDGDRVRNFYLGKAPRKSPTMQLAGASIASCSGFRRQTSAGAAL